MVDWVIQGLGMQFNWLNYLGRLEENILGITHIDKSLGCKRKT